MKNNQNDKTKNNHIEDLLEEYIPKVTCEITPYANQYEINIKNDIDESEDYQELMSIIRQASPNDVIKVYLETNGGLLDIGLQLIDELNRCPAQKFCYISSGTASMGTMLLLGVEWDMVDISPLATLLFHSVSYGGMGKHQELIEKVEHTQKLTEAVYDKFYRGFLTEEELENITKNKAELSLLGDDVVARIKLKYEAMEAEASGVPEDISEEDLQGMPTLPTYAEVMKMKKLDLQELFIELFDLTEEVDSKSEVE
jgi:ATP-dependent protease ClpP protease subunit